MFGSSMGTEEGQAKEGGGGGDCRALCGSWVSLLTICFVVVLALSVL